MSYYCKVQTQFKNPAALVAALSEAGGWTVEQIEVHESPDHLIGYHADIRPETAHIIIRRKHIGTASNDIGFVRGQDGIFTAIISEWDSQKHNEEWMKKVKQSYAFHAIRLQQTARGRSVSREVQPNGAVRVRISGYR